MAMTGGTAKLVSSGTPPGWSEAVKLYVYYKIGTQSIANNTTQISLGMYVTTPYKYDIGAWTDYYGSYVGTATSGANCKTFDGDIPNFYGTHWLVENQTITVTHNSNGSKTATIYWKWGVNSSWNGVMNNPSGSFNVTLPTIPRAATITSAVNFDDESNPTITYSNPAGNAVDSLQACISLTGAADNIAYRDISKTGSSYTFELTEDERNILRNMTKNSASTSVMFFVRTILSGTTYHSHLTKTLTIVNANPTVSITAGDTRGTTLSLTGDSQTIIKGYSDITYSVSAAGLKGAEINSYKVSCGTQTSELKDYVFRNVETSEIIAEVTDTRGYKTTYSLRLNLLPYENVTMQPTIVSPLDTDGKMTINIRGNWYAYGFGAMANVLAVGYRIKVNDGEWSEVYCAASSVEIPPDIVTPPSSVQVTKYMYDDYRVTLTFNGLDYRNTYYLEFVAEDYLSNVVSSAPLVISSIPVFDWGKNDFNFNVPIKIQGKPLNEVLLDMFYPVGAVYISRSATHPSEVFGCGSWEQIKDKFILAAGDTYTSGSTGGEATHTLTVSEMPSHTHSLKITTNGSLASTEYFKATANQGGTYFQPTTSATGGGAAHNNMPPYLALYMWERVSDE